MEKLVSKVKSNSIVTRIGGLGRHLLVRIIVAMCAGVGAAYVMPLWLTRVFETFNAVFSQLLGFVIPLIILGFVAPAIAEVGRKAGRMLLATVALAYLATLLAGFGSFWVSDALFPGMVQPLGGDAAALATDAAGSVPAGLTPYFTVEMPALMPVMTALILSFVLGVGSVAFAPESAMRRLLGEFRAIVSGLISKVVIPLLPIYIFGIFLNMTVAGQVAGILGTFAKIIAVIFALHVGVLLVQFGVAACFSRGSRNPLRLLATMMPAYFTALGTQSSAATISVTLRQAVKMGVPEQVAGFTVPLCATIHMSGSVLKIVACAVALMLATGSSYDPELFAGFICMLGVTIVAAPGIPGGAIMAALGLLTSMLGFTDADCALMIALYIAMDSFGTACNVTGDGALAIIIARLFSRRTASPATAA